MSIQLVFEEFPVETLPISDKYLSSIHIPKWLRVLNFNATDEVCLVLYQQNRQLNNEAELF
jgi:hypothetical protein